MARKTTGSRKPRTDGEETSPQGADAIDAPAPDPTQPDIEDAVVLPDPTEETPPDAPVEIPDDIPQEDPAPDVMPEIEPETPATPPPAPMPPAAAQPRRASVVPMFVGGAMMAALGYAAAYFGQLTPNDTPALQAAIAAQEAEIAALKDTAAGLQAALDAADPAPALAAVRSDVAAATENLKTDVMAQVSAIDDRLSQVERAPNADGTLADAALAAYTKQIEDLRAQIDEQKAGMEALAASATTQIEAARAEAAKIEDETAANARAGAVRAALSNVQVAMDTGTPFAQALPELETAMGAPLPDALTALADTGAPTLAMLQDKFPEAARAALAAARREGVSGEDGSRFSAFLRSQFDVRSVDARDGADADAVLSRAQAAVANGQVADALAEIASLPEVARATMTDWTALAEQRVAATTAIDELTQSLN